MALPAWLCITVWIFVSCTMILFNKAVLDTMEFPFPMFLVSWHMFVSICMTQVLSRTTQMLPGVSEEKVHREDVAKKIMPVALFFACSLVLSNKAYIYLSVSFLQMLKAFTPVAVLIVSFIAGLEKTSVLELLIVIVICTGVATTSLGEMNFSLIGFMFQTLAILFESSRLVLTNVLMKQLKLDPLSSLYYISPLCLCFILPAHFYFEFSSLPWDKIMTVQFAMIMAASGAVAFSLNVAVVVLIANTSALTLTLAGIVKDILLVGLSVVIFGSPVTLMQYFGYGLTLLALNIHKEYKKNTEESTKAVLLFCPFFKSCFV